MTRESRSSLSHRARIALAGLVVGLLLGGCAPVDDPSEGMSVSQKVALIERTPRSDVSIADLAEAFALGSKATPVQRDRLEQAVVGHTIEWDLPVYDVAYVEGRFEVTSQAIATANRAESMPMLRVVVFVSPQNDADQTLLMKLKSDDLIRVRGVVQEIRGRKIVAVVPAVVVRRQ